MILKAFSVSIIFFMVNKKGISIFTKISTSQSIAITSNVRIMYVVYALEAVGKKLLLCHQPGYIRISLTAFSFCIIPSLYRAYSLHLQIT